jgi:5-methylcytosine-specific restriction endonuclease McrA
MRPRGHPTPRGPDVKKTCLTCGVLIDWPATRCELHRKAKQRQRDAVRGTPSQRGYDYQYQQNRRAVLAVSRTCTYCGAFATTVDHIVALADGGTSDFENLVPSCSDCNSSRGAKLGNARRWR